MVKEAGGQGQRSTKQFFAKANETRSCGWINGDRRCMTLYYAKILHLVGKTSLWGGWKSLAIRTCGHLGTSATCPKPWSRKAANCKAFTWSLAPLLICRSNLNSLMQQLREKAGLLEAPWLRAASKSQQVWLDDPSLYFLEFPWCSSE